VGLVTARTPCRSTTVGRSDSRGGEGLVPISRTPVHHRHPELVRAARRVERLRTLRAIGSGTAMHWQEHVVHTRHDRRSCTRKESHRLYPGPTAAGRPSPGQRRTCEERGGASEGPTIEATQGNPTTCNDIRRPHRMSGFRHGPRPKAQMRRGSSPRAQAMPVPLVPVPTRERSMRSHRRKRQALHPEGCHWVHDVRTTHSTGRGGEQQEVPNSTRQADNNAPH
jgi:hypothetical protein